MVTRRNRLASRLAALERTIESLQSRRPLRASIDYFADMYEVRDGLFHYVHEMEPGMEGEYDDWPEHQRPQVGGPGVVTRVESRRLQRQAERDSAKTEKMNGWIKTKDGRTFYWESGPPDPGDEVEIREP